MRTLLFLAALAIGLGVCGLSAPAQTAGRQKDQAKIRPVTKTIEGKIQALDPQKGLLAVKKSQDEAVSVKLTPRTKLIVDGKPATLDQFRKGDVVVVTYEIRQDDNVAQMVALNRP
jgi:hypothetical protein